MDEFLENTFIGICLTNDVMKCTEGQLPEQQGEGDFKNQTEGIRDPRL